MQHECETALQQTSQYLQTCSCLKMHLTRKWCLSCGHNRLSLVRVVCITAMMLSLIVMLEYRSHACRRRSHARAMTGSANRVFLGARSCTHAQQGVCMIKRPMTKISDDRSQPIDAKPVVSLLHAAHAGASRKPVEPEPPGCKPHATRCWSTECRSATTRTRSAQLHSQLRPGWSTVTADC